MLDRSDEGRYLAAAFTLTLPHRVVPRAQAKCACGQRSESPARRLGEIGGNRRSVITRTVGERRPGVFQASLRGWRRLAAGLVLAPGLTVLGADALGLLAGRPARSVPSASAAPTRCAICVVRPARPTTPRISHWPTSCPKGATPPGVGQRRHAGRSAKRRLDRAANRSAKPTSNDPKLLLDMAKQAMAEGNLDKAQDLATQAQAHSAGVRWGLFDDTPSSVMRDVQRAQGPPRSRRGRQVAGRAAHAG